MASAQLVVHSVLVLCFSYGSYGILNSSFAIKSDMKAFQYNEPVLVLNNDIFGLDRSQQGINPLDFSGVDLQQEAQSFTSKLRSLTIEELGVTVMQRFFHELDYEETQPNYPKMLNQFVLKLQQKLDRYLTYLHTNKLTVENLYPKSTGSHLNNCCLIPKSHLKYDEQYGTAVTRQTSCDLVPSSLQQYAFNPGRNLTDVFQHITQHSIKWQYFISTQGIHNEFPAHDFGGVSHRDCNIKQDERHRAVYVSTVYPQRKNVVIMIDTGRAALSASQMNIAKAVARHVLLSLNEHDRVSVMNLNSDARCASHDDCLASQLCPLTYEAKIFLTNFIQHLNRRNSVTNHTLGFEKAFKMIWNTLRPDNSSISEEQAMIVYISPGSCNFTEARDVMRTIAYENARLRHKVVINTFTVVDTRRPLLYEETFLRNIALQNFENYDVKLQYPGPIFPGRMVSLSDSNDLSIRVGNFSDAFQWSPSQSPRINLPVKDDVGKGVVVPITWPCYHRGDLVGVVGVDIHLSDLVEDVTYFSTTSENAYAFLIDMNGYIIMHPAMTRPIITTIQPIHTNITHVEPSEHFKAIFPIMLQQRSGSKEFQDSESPNITHDSTSFPSSSYINTKYTWKHVQINITQWQKTAYIMVIKSVEDGLKSRKIKSSVASRVKLVYHRIDLLPADGMCIHLKQLATTDTSVLFLSANSFLHPFDHLTDTETKQMVKNYMAYLQYNDLIADPDHKEQAFRELSRKDVATISQINAYWTLQYKGSLLNDYIVRRYMATASGALYIFPGTLLSNTYDPTKRDWYRRALEFPGKMTLTAPYLDKGGAGYIVTLSYAIYEGKTSGVHEPYDRVVGVMALDITLGYLYKLLTEQISVCAHRDMRCFLMDDRGYLIAHPGLIEPNGLGPVEGKHITHKEALVAADVLTHEGFVQKKLCNSYSDRTIQRLYHFNTSIEDVLTNLKHGEQCSKYQISAIRDTNVFVGMVNQTTCGNTKAFCPCSVVDRMCLNCNRMEQTECECPCECPLQMNFCSGDILYDSDRNPNCPTFQEDQRVETASKDVMDKLPQCYRTHCEHRKTKQDCMGVLDCEWCYFDTDGATELRKPFCSTQRTCFAGVLGAVTPYGDQKPVPEAHIEKPYPSQSTPVGPVAGGIMACFLVLALGVYCYCHRVHRTGHQYMSTPENQYRIGMEEQLEDLDPENEGHIGPGGGHTNIVLATFDSPSVSPYRVNTGYRGHVANGNHTESDSGFCTVTPHEDSEIASTCIEPIIIGRERYRPGPTVPKLSVDTPILPPPPSGRRSQSPSPPSNEEVSLLLSQSVTSEQTVLSPTGGLNAPPEVLPKLPEGQTVFPHQVLAPVQVHMVDSHS